MTLLRDISPLHAAILRGEYDADLSSLSQAINARLKRTINTSFRVGGRIRVADDPAAGNLAGLLGTVIRVNSKTISVDLDNGHGYRISPKILEPISERSEEERMP